MKQQIDILSETNSASQDVKNSIATALALNQKRGLLQRIWCPFIEIGQLGLLAATRRVRLALLTKQDAKRFSRVTIIGRLANQQIWRWLSPPKMQIGYQVAKQSPA